MIQKQQVLKGAALLTAAGLAGRVIGFFYRIFLSRAIGAEGVGIYQLIFPIYALTYSLTVSGIQTSISRFVSAKTAAGDRGGARRIFFIGLTISCALSFTVSLTLLCFHDTLAAEFVKEPRSSELLRLLAYVVPFGSIHACINGYYYGMRHVKIPAAVDVFEHVMRLGAVMLIYRIQISNGITVTPALAVYSMIVEELLAALISATALAVHFSAQPRFPRPKYSISYYAGELLVLSVPLTLNRVLVNVLQSIEAFMIPLQLRIFGLSNTASLSVYGVLTGMALPLIMFPTAITSSICTMLLPMISEVQATGKLRGMASAIRKICFVCLSLGLACFALFFFFGDFAGNLLFHNTLAGSFVRAFAWICPLLYLNPALFAILNGLGKTSLVFAQNLTGVLIRIAFIIFTIPVFSISGFFVGMLVNQILVFLMAVHAIRKCMRTM